MTETRTTYFSLPQYSADSDSTLSRADSNEAFANIEARAAYDDGAEAASLPATNLKPGRYAKQTVSDGYTINRRSGSAWEYVGGSVAPVRQRFRAASDSAVALSVDRGADASTKFTVDGLGNIATLGGYTGPGLMLAADGETVDYAARGRVYVRTKADGERGLVLRPHGSGAAAMLTAMDSGGSAVTTIDALGRLQQRSFSSLGGAAMPSGQVSAIAPTNADDSVGGLLVHGWDASGTPAIAGKSILRVRGNAAGNDLITATPSVIAIGRGSWSGGAIGVTAPTIGLTGTVNVTGAASFSSTLAATGKITAPSAELTGNLLALGASGGPAIIAVATLPASGMTNQVVYHMTEHRFYRWNGSAWKRWTATHSWTGSASSVGSGGATISNWAEVENDGLVTVSSGSFHLGMPGIWGFFLDASSGFSGPALSVHQMSWPGGPLSGGFLIDQRYRGSGFTNAGNLSQPLFWSGIVTQDHIDAADFTVGLRSHNVSGNYANRIKVELLGLL